MGSGCGCFGVMLVLASTVGHKGGVVRCPLESAVMDHTEGAVLPLCLGVPFGGCNGFPKSAR